MNALNKLNEKQNNFEIKFMTITICISFLIAVVFLCKMISFISSKQNEQLK
jgi:hypothetical protein